MSMYSGTSLEREDGSPKLKLFVSPPLSSLVKGMQYPSLQSLGGILGLHVEIV